jgi:hypothetical protein
MLKFTEDRHHQNEAALELLSNLGAAYQNHVST